MRSSSLIADPCFIGMERESSQLLAAGLQPENGWHGGELMLRSNLECVTSCSANTKHIVRWVVLNGRQNAGRNISAHLRGFH